MWRAYVSDVGASYAMQVDADHAAISARGWGAVAAGTPAFPSGSQPRRVVGYSLTTGRIGKARVGTTTCGLWTGATLTFTVEADDGTIDTMTVIQRIPERIRKAP